MPVPTPTPAVHANPPYLASRTAARRRPIAPWRFSLRQVMFVWGVLLLAAFATPLSLDPLVFNWDAILHGPGTSKLPPLIMAGVGLLSVVLAALPLAPVIRGLLAVLLALTGIGVPLALQGMPSSQQLIPLGGMLAPLLLIPGLLLRHEYRDAALPRIVVTLGAIAGRRSTRPAR
jgi:hypothetical protein